MDAHSSARAPTGVTAQHVGVGLWKRSPIVAASVAVEQSGSRNIRRYYLTNLPFAQAFNITFALSR